MGLRLLILSKKDVPELVYVGDFLQRHACPTRILHFSVMPMALQLDVLYVLCRSSIASLTVVLPFWPVGTMEVRSRFDWIIPFDHFICIQCSLLFCGAAAHAAAAAPLNKQAFCIGVEEHFTARGPRGSDCDVGHVGVAIEQSSSDQGRADALFYI